MDRETREAVIDTIRTYYAESGDSCLLEMIGWLPCGTASDEQHIAVVNAVLPLLSDEDLNCLTRHIAELFVAAGREETEVAA